MININKPGKKDQMTKHERVMATLEFKDTDRVALFDLMENDGIIEYFSARKLKAPENTEYNLKVVCEAISNCLDLTRSVYAPRVSDTIKTELGFVIRQEKWTSWIVKRPFSNNKEIKEFIKRLIEEVNNSNRHSRWNYFGSSGYDKKDNEELYKIKEWTSGTVIFADESPVGLDTLMDMLGIDRFSIIYNEEPELVSECLEVLCEHEVQRIKLAANPDFSPVVLVYCDLAYKGGLIFSPAFLRKEFFPRLKRIVDAWHGFDMKCIFHSDGNYMEVMDDFIASGLDGINPIEPLSGWELIDVRKKYPSLVLMGNIDVSQLLSNGSPEEVKKAVKKAIDDIYPGGGLLLGSSTELGPYVDPYNYINMNLFAREYSRIDPFTPRDLEEISVEI